MDALTRLLLMSDEEFEKTIDNLREMRKHLEPKALKDLARTPIKKKPYGT